MAVLLGGFFFEYRTNSFVNTFHFYFFLFLFFFPYALLQVPLLKNRRKIEEKNRKRKMNRPKVRGGESLTHPPTNQPQIAGPGNATVLIVDVTVIFVIFTLIKVANHLLHGAFNGAQLQDAKGKQKQKEKEQEEKKQEQEEKGKDFQEEKDQKEREFNDSQDIEMHPLPQGSPDDKENHPPAGSDPAPEEEGAPSTRGIGIDWHPLPSPLEAAESIHIPHSLLSCQRIRNRDH
jgi:hypothetical protein